MEKTLGQIMKERRIEMDIGFNIILKKLKIQKAVIKNIEKDKTRVIPNSAIIRLAELYLMDLAEIEPMLERRLTRGIHT